MGWPLTGFSQDKETAMAQPDSVSYKERYGIRIGVDISKPARSFVEDDYTGFAVQADYRLKKRLFPAIELGHDDKTFSENNLTAQSQGNYVKLGANYNVYDNWLDMQNEIYVGARYGFSSFKETLKSYSVYNKDQYFPSEEIEPGKKFKNLSAHWLELQFGIRVEVFQNLFLGVHAELKTMITETQPDNFDNLWVPGFNRNYESNSFGVGWGYTVSYMIPIKTKEHKVNLED